VGIISAGQIDYMLAGRFSDEALRTHMQAADKWLELLLGSRGPNEHFLWGTGWSESHQWVERIAPPQLRHDRIAVSDRWR